MVLVGKKWVVIILIAAVLGSAFSVTYTKFLSRKHFVALQRLYQKRDVLQVEWQKLRLEHSTWLTHGRIERVATHKLNLVYPSPSEIIVIKQ